MLYTGANGNWDDYNTQVTLSFPVVIFGVSSPTIYVSTKGVSMLLFFSSHVFAGQGIDALQLISFAGTSSYTNQALYSTTVNSPAVLPFCTCTFPPTADRSALHKCTWELIIRGRSVRSSSLPLSPVLCTATHL